MSSASLPAVIGNDTIIAAQSMGLIFAKSGMYGANNEQQGQVLALMCIIERKTPSEILATYDIIGGKLRKKAVAMLAEFRARGGKHQWILTGEEDCADEEKRAASLKLEADGSSITVTQTIAQSRKAGAIFKDGSGWSKSPGAMLRARCISRGVQMLMPEIVAGGGPDDDEVETPANAAEGMMAEARATTPPPIKEMKRAKVSETPPPTAPTPEPVKADAPPFVPDPPQAGAETVPPAPRPEPFSAAIDPATGKLTEATCEALTAMIPPHLHDAFTKLLLSKKLITTGLEELPLVKAQGMLKMPAATIAGIEAFAKGGARKMRPSSLPMLAKCPRFQGGTKEADESAFVNAGVARHEALAILMRGDETALESLPYEDADSVKWASEYIRFHADLRLPLLIEETRLLRLFPVEMQGTPDIVCGDQIFDLKTRWRDYTAQMAAYALMVFKANPHVEKVTAHLMFCADQRVQKIEFTVDEALGIVLPIIAAAHDASLSPALNEYCGWCAKQLACPAIQAKVQAMVEMSDHDIAALNPAEITDAATLARALALRKTLTAWVDKWGDAVRARALEMNEAGETIPGWSIQTRQGSRMIADLAAAQAASGLPAAAFLACCKVTLGTLEKIYAEQNGMKVAAAKRELSEKLGGLVTNAEPTKWIVND